MKFFLISDSNDTLVGMRLAGIEGVLSKTREETLLHLEKITKDETVAVLLLTEKLVKLCVEEINQYKLTLAKPLLVEIPSKGSDGDIGQSIGDYISSAVGIRI